MCGSGGGLRRVVHDEQVIAVVVGGEGAKVIPACRISVCVCVCVCVSESECVVVVSE